MEDNHVIMNTDCLGVFGLPALPSQHVDLVVTDPPYGIDFNSNHRKATTLKSTDGISNDGKDNIGFLEEVATELYRILKNDSHMYWFTRWDKLPEHIPMLEKVGFKVKNNLVWKKNNWSMGDLKGAYAGQYECILFCHKGRKLLNEVGGKNRHSDILEFDRIAPQRLVHSHQKPLDLLEFLIMKSSEIGDLVLDPFMGSGSTAVASLNLKRYFAGYEMDKGYFDIANQRIEEAYDIHAV